MDWGWFATAGRMSALPVLRRLLSPVCPQIFVCPQMLDRCMFKICGSLIDAAGRIPALPVLRRLEIIRLIFYWPRSI